MTYKNFEKLEEFWLEENITVNLSPQWVDSKYGMVKTWEARSWDEDSKEYVFSRNPKLLKACNELTKKLILRKG